MSWYKINKKVFSERQMLAEEIIFLSEKRGMTANGLQLGAGGAL